MVFIAHSLGGIVVKDVRVMLSGSRASDVDVEQAIRRSKTCRLRTKLIVFLGTPHRGSLYAGWGGIASNLACLALQDTNKKIIETLDVNSEVLDNIQEEFNTIVHESGIKIHSFQEARGLSGLIGLDGKVSQQS